MIRTVVNKMFGSYNDREIKKLRPVIQKILNLDEKMMSLEDSELQQYTSTFHERLDAGETLDAILPEAFAVAREAASRVLGEKPYVTQLIGGMILHQGRIAEMQTGEGKTLTSVLPVYLNALARKGVHVVTVNDYLAKRDSEWMGKVFSFLGVSVAAIYSEMSNEQKSDAYNADITYGTNNEFGFDFLRDNMKYNHKEFSQRGFAFAIIDEVDSILIDEARTPLIISGPAEVSREIYATSDTIAQTLEAGVDYEVDEKDRQVVLTDQGVENIEERFGFDNLYDLDNVEALHHLMQALRAHTLYIRDKNYIIHEKQVKIVDEFTGRIAEGRRFGDGLHQAIEAKECVKLEDESQTLASVTLQNYFRMYPKLAGMTGTAQTEAAELKKIYGLEVISVPTHRPVARVDSADGIFKTHAMKVAAVVRKVQELQETGQPVLIGTASVQRSEEFSEALTEANIPHDVLNAKNHEAEAEIVANAGQVGHVTIATNMAGRGTDIKLSEEAKECGGLQIIGTERHESRRIDNQLRGRAGRQGDPGASKFYLSLEDDLLRIFGESSLAALVDKIWENDEDELEHRMLSNAVERSQRALEGQNFDIRKRLIDYDEALNTQREVVYDQRNDILQRENVSEMVFELIDSYVQSEIFAVMQEGLANPDDIPMLEDLFVESLDVKIDVRSLQEDFTRDDYHTLALETVRSTYETLQSKNTEILQQHLEKVLFIQILDTHWREHLVTMDHLRESIGLRGYSQKDPLREYKKDGFALFRAMNEQILENILKTLFKMSLLQKPQATSAPSEDAQDTGRMRRNSICKCGSGERYKSCCGKMHTPSIMPAPEEIATI